MDIERAVNTFTRVLLSMNYVKAVNYYYLDWDTTLNSFVIHGRKFIGTARD